MLPKNTNYLNIKKWIANIDETESSSPTLLGLPENAEAMLLARKANGICNQLLQLQDMEHTSANELLGDIKSDSSLAVSSTPQWMIDILETLMEWRTKLPGKDMKHLPRKENSVKNPLYRSLSREVSIGISVLNTILSDIESLKEVVDCKEKATNDIRDIVNSLSKEHVPKSWSRYYIVNISSVSLWISDFLKRIEQLQFFCSSSYVNDPIEHVWLGGLFSPEAFVATTRQAVAQRNMWPLEQLLLMIYIGRSDELQTSNTFIFDGLRLNGAD